MQTIGHHTCKKDGGVEYVLQQAPFEAIHDPQNPIEENRVYQFAGSGYYFWDNDMEQAKRWGDMRCNERYYVIQNTISLQEKMILDLVGRREDQLRFQVLVNKAEKIGYGIDPKYGDWTFASFIEFYKELNTLVLLIR